MKTPLRFYLTPARIATTKIQMTANVDEDAGKKELSYTVGGNLN
jgi:hypothetical protein